MVISEIRSLYRDENDLFRTVTKRIWEEWNEGLQQWDLRRIEFIFEDPELPVPSDNPAVAVEQRKPGWLIPPEWEFQSEVWEYEQKPVSETAYDYEGDYEVRIIREQCNCLNRGFSRIIRITRILRSLWSSERVSGIYEG
jgi:hypothetical protein